jgi:hypothetical protein
LIPLIHTRPGQRALEVKIIYRFPEGGGLQQTAKLDDPEIVGLSVERTTWTVWTPQGWKLKDFDGNMTATAAEGRELLQLEGMLSELGEANRALSSGKLDYGDAEAAYRDANALAEMVQQKKRELMSKTGRGTLTLSGSIQPSGMDTEVRQQQELLKGNWDNNYANRKRADKSSKNAGQTAQEKTAWGFNGAAPQEPQLRLAGNNTFTGSVTTNGGQLFNDNVAVDNAYFANGQLLPPINLNGPGGASPYPYGGGPITAGMRSGGYTIDSTSTANVTAQNYGNNGAQILTQNSSGSVNIVNSNARSNNLGNGAAATTQTFSGTILGSGGVLGTDVQVNGMKFNSSPPLAGSFRNLNERGNKKTAPAAPAMAADPFAAPAPAPPPTTADPFAAPAAAVDKPMAKDAVRKAIPVDDDGKEQRHMLDERPVTLAQTVESLRPTGRRALGIELPLDGTTHHFSKLKDHAVLEVAIQRMGDPKTTSRLLCLSGGLLLWLAIGWKLKRRSQAV